MAGAFGPTSGLVLAVCGDGLALCGTAGRRPAVPSQDGACLPARSVANAARRFGGPQVVALDAEPASWLQAHFAQEGASCLLALPVGKSGVVVLGHPAPEAWTAERVSLLASGARLAGMAADLHPARRPSGVSLRRMRIAALGELAASAAHEIRNPLTAIRGFLQLVAAHVRKDPEAHYLRVAGQEIERIERITGDLLLLSPSARLARSACDLHLVLSRVIELAAARAEERGVMLALRLEPDLPLPWADPERLEQVFLNLVRNAVEAMVRPGRVDVAARPLPGGGVEVTVRDQGPGIAADVLARLFEPFFTTKAGGTGLGLAVSESIIVAFGGGIAASSVPGGGALFTVRLPAPPPADAPVVPVSPADSGHP